jgi:hypothetical protein
LQVNAGNIKAILPELFRENITRGQGLLCQAIMKAQAASLSFTAVFAALVAVVNSKFPEVGLLLCSRVLQQFKLSYRRSDKPLCKTSLEFVAHLVNQHVLNEVVALEVRTSCCPVTVLLEVHASSCGCQQQLPQCSEIIPCCLVYRHGSPDEGCSVVTTGRSPSCICVGKQQSVA